MGRTLRVVLIAASVGVFSMHSDVIDAESLTIGMASTKHSLVEPFGMSGMER